METVELDKEKFSMQRAYLYALTIREDVTQPVKNLIKNIEMALSKEADVKSHFEIEDTKTV